MGFLRSLRISTFIFSVGLVYFAVHFFVGQQGLLSWRGYIQSADQLTIERDELVAKRKILEARIKNLQPGRVNTDAVEELAFAQLRLTAPGDIVVIMPKQAPPTVVGASMQTSNP
jgi:cell division protein FtsB